ncbi:hypothetical protein [Diaminobutyricibacter sp. McL0608]|uniref:hypothetical protein n=1 Tax=Leifsonia sp. McL0608 TaxID=3143537 RepID=UPI0031F306BE
MSETATGAPHPRVLVFGLTAEEIEVVRPLAGSLRVTSDIRDVHAEEHDVLILAGAEFHNYQWGFPRRIVFAPKPQSMSERPSNAASFGAWGAPSSPSNTAARTQFTPARDFDVTEFARQAGLESLARRSCIPGEGETYRGVNLPVVPNRVSHSLVQERLDRPLILASVFEAEAGDDPDSAIWLPYSALSYLQDWAIFAFAYWRRDAPETFPTTADWHRSGEWASPMELEARHVLNAFDQAEAERRRAADDARHQLLEELESAEADGGSWRGILSQTGDPLVASVKETLELLGFSVIDSDGLPEHKGKKREDLRVSDGEWIALVEVKGYAAAAKSNDLLQLASASVAYASSAGRAPDALWYVTNVYRERDPAQREIPLVGREDDLDSFGDDHHGCLVDTRELFALRQRVATQRTSPEDARNELRSALGRFIASRGKG